MAKIAKFKKPEQEDLDFKGMYHMVNEFNIKAEILDMLSNGDLDGWDDPKNEADFITAMDAETDLKRKVVYCIILSNFIEE